jgi:rsbT co-antagonist protein RsbR
MVADKVLGVMAVQSYTTPRLYGEHERDLLTTIASQAAIALENASLFEEAQRALADVREANERQRELLDMVREMSTPLVPIAEGVLVLPLVGTVDSRRAAQIMDTLLEGISSRQARVVILDITGVPVVDTSVANYLLQATQAVHLLGAECILVGITPEVAQTIVGLGVDLRKLVTRSDLQSGVEYALRLLRRKRLG